jgi:hypothetical protein
VLIVLSPNGLQGPEWQQPVVKGLQLGGLQPIESALAIGPHADETRLTQHFEMLGNAGLAEAGGFNEVAGRPFALPQEIEDGAAAGFGNGFKWAHAIICR